MNIIDINGEIGLSLTVDSTLITVDSTEYTADMTQTNIANTYNITLLPSKFYSTMKLILTNELTEEVNEINVTATKVKGYTVINFYLEGIKNNDSFEGVLYNEDKTEEVYRGKFFATNQTDLQEFTMTPKTNNIIII